MSKLLEDPNPAIRFRAARSILSMAPRFAPPDEPIDVEGVLTAEARKLNVQFNEIHPATQIVYEDERERALNHLMQRAGEDYTVDEEEGADRQDDGAKPETSTPSLWTQGESGGDGAFASEVQDLRSQLQKDPLPTPLPEYREGEPEPEQTRATENPPDVCPAGSVCASES
jgi:hypothetical protein